MKTKARTFERRDPLSGEVVTIAPACTVEDAVAIAETAAAAFPGWSAIGLSERRAMLNKAADILQARAAEFTELMMGETGAAAPWVQFNVKLAAGMLREAASMTTQITDEVIPSDVTGCLSMAVRVPVGVVLGIAQWNATIILGIRAIAFPLACGNTVILKAIEISPCTQQLIAQVLTDAGLPKGVVNVVTNDAPDNAAIVEALIAHPAVRRVNFTGSTRVGRRICMSTERIVVDEKIADEFVAKLSGKARTLRTGNPRKKKGVVLGSLVDCKAAERVRKLINDALDKGAMLAAGGHIDGMIVSATVIDKNKFGNAHLPRRNFWSLCQRRAGKRLERSDPRRQRYRLWPRGGGVRMRHIAALDVTKRIDAGSTHINGRTVQDEPQIPFGGMKASGYGRFGSRAGIHEFTELRWITIETKPHHYPF